MGARKRLNGTSKVNRQTDRQTDRQTNTHTNIWTFRLIESIGPEGQCFENWACNVIICVKMLLVQKNGTELEGSLTQIRACNFIFCDKTLSVKTKINKKIPKMLA